MVRLYAAHKAHRGGYGLWIVNQPWSKPVALRADHISRYEAAQHSLELHADTAQS
jgi:hypothetical protein